MKQINSPLMAPSPMGSWENHCSSLSLIFFLFNLEIAALRDLVPCGVTSRREKLRITSALLIADASG